MIRPTRRPRARNPDLPRQWWVWVVYLILFALSVPWYLPADRPLPLWLGVPHWVILSLAACLAIAAFTAFVVYRFWPDEEPDP